MENGFKSYGSRPAPTLHERQLRTASIVGARAGCLFATVVACAAPLAAAPALAREIVATEAQRGSTLRLAPRDRLRLSLPSNGTTGYTWTAVALPPNLRALDGDIEAPPQRQGAAIVGAGGRQVLMFEAVRRGGGVLRLRYQQAWAGGSSGETFSLRVTSGR